MVSTNFKQANEKFLLDTGYTQAQINKMAPGKKANLNLRHIFSLHHLFETFKLY